MKEEDQKKPQLQGAWPCETLLTIFWFLRFDFVSQSELPAILATNYKFVLKYHDSILVEVQPILSQIDCPDILTCYCYITYY